MPPPRRHAASSAGVLRSAQLLDQLSLGRRAAYRDHLRAHLRCKLHGEVSQATDADRSDFFVDARLVAVEVRPHRHAGAKQRCGLGGRMLSGMRKAMRASKRFMSAKPPCDRSPSAYLVLYVSILPGRLYRSCVGRSRPCSPLRFMHSRTARRSRCGRPPDIHDVFAHCRHVMTISWPAMSGSATGPQPPNAQYMSEARMPQ